MIEEQCPWCDGKGESFAIACGPKGCTPTQLGCDRCHGSGKVTAEKKAQYDQGQKMREDRISRGLTQRQEAQRRGMSAPDYSKREHGILPYE